LAFSRRQVARPAAVNLNSLVQDMDRMLRRVIGEDVELVTRLATELQTVRVDPGQIEQVILNVAVNARDAMPNGGTLTLETANLHVTEEYKRLRLAPQAGHYVVLAIGDTGHGMDSQILSRVFEPFFTTKENGTGLGLSTSYGIIKKSGGDIWVDSKPGAGTTFRIYLPIVAEPIDELRAPQDSPVLRGTETILLVEDEDGVRHVVETMLQRHGYRVLPYPSAADALTQAERYAGVIDLLITDVVMPGMSGRRMAERLLKQRPSMRVLFVSGYGETLDTQGSAAFLQKPFTTGELALKIREVMQA
jgi:two-component system, cell cycle sensor histidine kinase and response regulator CckA